VTYQAQSDLAGDSAFAGRSVAAATQQAESFINDQRPEYIALSKAILRGESDKNAAMIRTNAGSPGIADKADNGDGTIDQAKVTDEDLLSITQANWPVVAGLYYDANGAPLP
jgi:predicted pyridoxine 5'-phosphate oxidase superfamily flavin-nucleotide-binding protein